MAWNGKNGQNALPREARGGGLRTGALYAALGVLIAGVLAWMLLGVCSESTDDGQRRDSSAAVSGKRLKKNKADRKSAKESVRQAMPSKLPKRKSGGGRPRRDVDMFVHFTGKDRRMAEAVQSALDNDDLEKTVAAATEALSSTNAEVRLNAVDALGWFGVRALPELTGAMADADEGVRQSAENHFELAVQELESPEDQFRIAMAALGTLSDEDQLTSLGGIVNCAATAMIEDEKDTEAAARKRLQVVQTLVDVIEGGGSAANVKAATEAYNDITGNEWKGVDEAERYLQDPDNYDPDASTVENDE